jgi:Txe/YoeB family toxin of Txe-Axe toxin-antitoxin module
MKIIQSFWSCNKQNLITNNFGWYASEYHIMSWALSCLQLRKYYNEVVLYADTVSAKLLIDILQLPYTKIECKLDSLNNYHPQLWALPKLYAYSQQDEPFLHVDGDVFIWKPFNQQLLHSDLIAQNMEAATSYYAAMWQSFEAVLKYYPPEILEDRKQKNPILAYNAGIMGGSDIDFFKTYTQKAFEFIDKNSFCFDNVNVSNFNIFFEQYLFHCLVKQQSKTVGVLIEDIIGDNEYKGYGDFVEVPHNKQYLHLLGNYKRHPFVCKQMSEKLRNDYPEYYYKIIQLFKDNNLSLIKDYYYFTETKSLKLQNRYNQLKEAYLKNSIIPNAIKREIYFQSSKSIIVKESINKSLEVDINSNQTYNDQILDVIQFEKDLENIVLGKFVYINNEYLYARDINQTQYYQYLFEEETYNKKIVADTIFEVIESKFDWTEIENNELATIKLLEQLQSLPSKFYTAIIPECDLSGYSLINIDELDICIFQLLEQPKTIANLFEAVKQSFDEIEINSDPLVFEKLIFGRIKMGVQCKTLKAIIE